MSPGHASRPLLCIDRAENLAAFRSGSMLQAQGRARPRSACHFGPLSADPSQYRARIFGGLVDRLSRVPVVGPNFDPATQRVTHKFFLCCLQFLAAIPVHRSQVEPRPPVRCGLNRWRVWVEPRAAVWPAPFVFVVWEFWRGPLYRFAFARAIR